MKPALFFTVRRNFAGQLEVMTVTAQRGKRLWGRNTAELATDASQADCFGQFPTRDLAEKAKGLLASTLEDFRPLELQAEATRIRIEQARDRAIESVIRECTPQWEIAA